MVGSGNKKGLLQPLERHMVQEEMNRYYPNIYLIWMGSLDQCFLKYLEEMKLLLFTDGSVNTKLRVGYGAYLAFLEDQQSLTGHIKLRRFEDTSSSKIELQTLLWALSEITATEVISYTDSQNIVELNLRRKKLEENNYYARNGKQLKNHELYKQFYQITDNLNITFTQIRGHTPANSKSHRDMIFSLVDSASRKALRAETANHKSGSYV